MTVQRRRLIELSDILAVELRCKQCGTTLGFSLDRLPGTGRIVHCPNCHGDWLEGKLGAKFEEAIRALDRLRDALADSDGASEGFRLAIEVTDQITPEKD